MTGMPTTARIRSRTLWSSTLAATAQWYWANVLATSSALSLVSIPTSSPRIVTGWPPSWKTASSEELRVLAEGF